MSHTPVWWNTEIPSGKYGTENSRKYYYKYKAWARIHAIHLLEYDYTVTMTRIIQTWIISTLLVASTTSFGDYEEINRLNYGIYMTKKKDITVTHQKWRHTLVLQIPTLTKVGEIPLPECDFELSCQEECLTERTQLALFYVSPYQHLWFTGCLK